MWFIFNKLSCSIDTIPGSSASYLQFRSSSLRHPHVVLSSVTHFVHVDSELRSMVSESVPQTNHSKLWSWTLWTCTSWHIWKLFFNQPSRCSLHYRLIFDLTTFCLVDKMSRVHVVSFCNLIGTARARQWKSTTFSVNVTRLSPPPRFWVYMFLSMAVSRQFSVKESSHCDSFLLHFLLVWGGCNLVARKMEVHVVVILSFHLQ